MKKTLLIALTIFSTTLLKAQDEVQFGLRGGLNIASINGDSSDEISLDPRLNFHLGLVAEIPITDLISFQPELVYSRQGATFEETDDFGFGAGDINIEGAIKMDYINLPLMAKFYVAEGFSLEVGPQIGFLVLAETETEASFGGETETDTVDIKDELSSIDFGFNFGAGYKLENGLNFGLRYNLGISNINDGEGSEDFVDRNGVLQLSVGYFF